MTMRDGLVAAAFASLLGAGWLTVAADARGRSSEETGQALFAEHCGQCHLLPEPTDLPYAIWDTVVLPRMRGLVAGLSVGQPAGLSDREWNNLRAYGLSEAPARLTAASSALPTASDFRAVFPEVFMSPPSTSFVSPLSGGGLLQADINKESIFVYDAALRPVQRLRTGRGVTDLKSFHGQAYATVIGSFSPTDEAVGQLIRLGPAGADTLVDGLRRPTGLLVWESTDGAPEFIVTEYGRWSGSLRCYRATKSGLYLGTTISPRPGPMSIVSETDTTFLVLYGQGDERIVRYHRVDGSFREETLIRFPPSYGSSSLKLTDWNDDPFPDLIYTAGDLADYRSDPKPYHGVRIYLGAPDGGYRLAEFLAYPGAYAAEVADFNGDGTKEIAAVSFFPDFRNDVPASAVIFRRGEGRWVAEALPAAGRWIRLAAGDVDNDGDVDLVAGSLAMETYPDGGQLNEWVGGGLPFVCWKNLNKHNSPP